MPFEHLFNQVYSILMSVGLLLCVAASVAYVYIKTRHSSDPMTFRKEVGRPAADMLHEAGSFVGSAIRYIWTHPPKGFRSIV